MHRNAADCKPRYAISYNTAVSYIYEEIAAGLHYVSFVRRIKEVQQCRNTRSREARIYRSRVAPKSTVYPRAIVCTLYKEARPMKDRRAVSTLRADRFFFIRFAFIESKEKRIAIIMKLQTLGNCDNSG